MNLVVTNINEVEFTGKPWGWEKWLQSGKDSRFNFALKQIHLNSGNRTSLQVHMKKSESIMILSGSGIIETHSKEFDVDRYLSNDIDQDELISIFEGLVQVEIGPGSLIHIPPRTIHRMYSDTDLLYVEASTTELNDVIRLKDDLNRPNNTI